MNLQTTNQNHFSQLQTILEKSNNRAMTNNEILETLQQSLFLLQTENSNNPNNLILTKAIYTSINQLTRLCLTTTKGFAEFYFETLPTCKTPNEAFNFVNSYYKQQFGENKYKDYKTFKTVLRMS